MRCTFPRCIVNRAHSSTPCTFVIITGSAFLWLCVLLFISAVLRGARQQGGMDSLTSGEGARGRAAIVCLRQHPHPTSTPTISPHPSTTPIGFVPLRQTAAAYAGVVLAAVAIEEAARYGVWQLHL